MLDREKTDLVTVARQNEAETGISLTLYPSDAPEVRMSHAIVSGRGWAA